eukprot:EG_transcript_16369
MRLPQLARAAGAETVVRACPRCPRQFTLDGCTPGWHIAAPTLQTAITRGVWTNRAVFEALYRNVLLHSDFGKLYCEPLHFPKRQLTDVFYAAVVHNLLLALRDPSACVLRDDVRPLPGTEPWHACSAVTFVPRWGVSPSCPSLGLNLPDAPLLWVVSNVPLRALWPRMMTGRQECQVLLRRSGATLLYPEGSNRATVTVANSPVANHFPGTQCEGLQPVTAKCVPDGYERLCRPMLNKLLLDPNTFADRLGPRLGTILQNGVQFLDAIQSRVVVDPALTSGRARCHRMTGADVLDWWTGYVRPPLTQAAYWSCVRPRGHMWTGHRAGDFLRAVMGGGPPKRRTTSRQTSNDS